MEAFKSIYRSRTESHFRYGNIIWDTYGEVLLTKLQKIQNGAAPVVTKSDYDAEAGPLIDELQWNPSRELIISDTAVMMFEIMNNMAPSTLLAFLNHLGMCMD